MDSRRRQSFKIFDLSKRFSEMVSDFKSDVRVVQNFRAKWKAMSIEVKRF